MSDDTDSGGKEPPLARYPAMGRNTQTSKSSPFSVRLPKELKDAAMEKAASSGVELGQYIRDLIETDLSGTRPRRRRRKHDDIRKLLAELHAAVIRLSIRIEQNRGLGLDHEYQQQMVVTLRDAVSALLALDLFIGAR